MDQNVKEMTLSMSQDLISQNTIQEMQTFNVASNESKMSNKNKERFSP